MRISVALATYNGAAHLREQLASLAAQTLPPAELVVGDDGSTDDTIGIVRAFAATAPFPVVVLGKAERLGFSDNFLNAAEACRHEVVAFCDQDDVWLPHKLETCAARMQADDSLIVLHTLTVTDGDLKPTGLHWDQGIYLDRAYDALELDPYITGWGNAMIFRRELVHLLPRAGRPRQPQRRHLPLSHDTWVYMLAAALGRVSHMTAPLILYRQHQMNAEGVALPPRRSKWAELTDVELLRYREQALINGRMAALFEELGGKPGPFAGPARAAAAAFAGRRALLSARAGMFDGPSVAARFRAYREFQRLVGPPRPWIGSHLKSLLLGVGGLNALRTPRTRLDHG